MHRTTPNIAMSAATIAVSLTGLTFQLRAGNDGCFGRADDVLDISPRVTGRNRLGPVVSVSAASIVMRRS